MQAIETKYIGPTNHRGARVVARAYAGKVTVSYDHALNVEGNHDAAARALAAKLGWEGNWFGGGNASSTGNVYVNVRTVEPSFEVGK